MLGRTVFRVKAGFFSAMNFHASFSAKALLAA
jgi:hypothetical protein